jgi:hypothetical protein
VSPSRSRIILVVIGLLTLLPRVLLLPRQKVEAAASVNFPDVMHYKTGGGARSISAVDLNRDGALDLVTADAAANSVSVLPGVGNGTFRAAVSVATLGKAPFGLAVGRFNGDEFPDVATVDLASSSVSVFMNDGAGALAATATLDVGGGPVSLDATDLNGDRFDDLVAVNSATDSVDVFMNLGGKGFAARARFPTAASSPRGVAFLDVNRDGRPDIAAANSRGSSVSMLVNDWQGRVRPVDGICDVSWPAVGLRG